MKGIRFTKYIAPKKESNSFEQMLRIFKDILLHTSGDVSEALSWLTQLVNQFELEDDAYTISDFIVDLKRKGYISDLNDPADTPIHTPTDKLVISLRKQALEDIFDQIRRSKSGEHNTHFSGRGTELDDENRKFEFGDKLEHISISESIRNAYANHGIDEFRLTGQDLEVRETFHQSQSSTVLMIDISHSMILYGEDRITPAKKVAMALSELITTRFPKDTLDIIVFGNDAWEIEIKDLPYLKVGPYHTNTIAGLELAMDILRKRKKPNKQIMMITDGKPTCMKRGKGYYKNPYGLDAKILNRTLGLASKCRKMRIPITTFMIARDPYLVEFVDTFTKVNNGKAFYSSLEGLGEFIFMDYKDNKRKKR